MDGLNVCPMHGGKTPSARARGQLRLLDSVDLAISKIRTILQSSDDERVVLKAAEMVLDRTGLEAKNTQYQGNEIITELLVGRMLQRRGDLPRDAPHVEPEEDDIVEAEIVEDDEPGLTAEDLI